MCVGPLIAQYKTNTEDGQFASFLADFSSSSTACITSFGVQAFLVGSLVGRMTGSLLDGGVFESLALITEEPLVGIDVRFLMV